MKVDRSFGLPTGLYMATAGAYLAFLTLMASMLLNPGLVIPLAICALSVVAGFGGPTI